jgi:hypothetical protein
VRFLKNDLPYLRGELAGFPDPVAAKLIEKGFAELHKDGVPVRTGQRVPDLGPDLAQLSARGKRA